MHLREGRLDDLPYIADIGTEALWDDEIVRYLAPYRAQYPLSHRDNQLHRYKRRFFSGDRLIVAVTDEQDPAVNEKIIGFAFWSDTNDTSKLHPLPSSFLGNGFEQAILRAEACFRWYLNIDRSYDKMRFAKFWEVLADNPFFEDISQYWELEVLAIAPDYQRQGAGSMLLAWGMDQAQQHDMPVVVAATFTGEQIYRKHNFRECGRLNFEGSEFSWAAMIWYPEGSGPAALRNASADADG